MRKILVSLAILVSASASFAGSGYVCVSGYLHKPNGTKDYVGTSDCSAARIANGFACVSGYLYKPDSSKDYVGTSDCRDGNFGD